MKKSKEFSSKINVQVSLAMYIATFIFFLGFYVAFDYLMPIRIYYPMNTMFFYDMLVYYTLLVFGSFLTQFIIIQMLVRYKQKEIPIKSDDDGGSLWDYFIQDATPKKTLTLILFLLVASLSEEIIFRYFLFQAILLPFQFIYWNIFGMILATAVTSLLFGIAHRSNGFFGYVVNSIIGGVFFGLFFYQWGLFGSWMLHFLWNFLVILDYYYKYKLSSLTVEN